MYACPNCQATNCFMAFKDGVLVRILEDNQDRDGLETVKELLCLECNHWFPNPFIGNNQRKRTLTCEVVTMTGLRSKGTIKVIATGVKFPFDFATHEKDAVKHLKEQSQVFIANLFEFASVRGHELALRVKEEGNPNTWVYRLDARKVRKAIE